MKIMRKARKVKWVISFLLLLAVSASCSLQLSDIDSTGVLAPEEEDLAKEGFLVYSSTGADARGISISPSSGYVTLTEGPSGAYHLSINLRPQGLPHYRKVLFSVYNSTDASGWTVNIGDSATNDGYGGDGGTQSNDSELQVLNGTYSVYAADTGSSALLYSTGGYNPASGSRYVRYEISSNTVRTWINGDTSSIRTVSSPHIFALDGQSDNSGPVNYTIYAGFNRTIGNPGRTGNGITQVYVYLQDKVDYELINVGSNYSGNLNHLMYKKSVLSSKWYANTGFSGYTYFLNGKNPDNWDEKEKEHIYAMEYWKPAQSRIQNIVFLVAGQQGILADRQDYPAVVTGQGTNWHHYSGAPGTAINTWKYFKSGSRSISWKSVAGQIIADGTANGGSYFGMTPSNTCMVMIFDACFYYDDLSASRKTALVTDYLEYLFSKVGNNTGNQLKNIYLAGASRGGALVYRMAYEMRHNSTWTSRAGSARIIVSGFDAVANNGEGELFTGSSRTYNPNNSNWYAWNSTLNTSWTNKTNFYSKQIAGGAPVVPIVGRSYRAMYIPQVTSNLEFAWVNLDHIQIGREWHTATADAHLKWLAKWVVR